LAYVSAGNSTNKKDAEKNAARDYVNYLVRCGKITEQEIPADAESGQAPPILAPPLSRDNNRDGGLPSLMSQSPHVFKVTSK
jgi:hypothetical protein